MPDWLGQYVDNSTCPILVQRDQFPDAKDPVLSTIGFGAQCRVAGVNAVGDFGHAQLKGVYYDDPRLRRTSLIKFGELDWHGGDVYCATRHALDVSDGLVDCEYVGERIYGVAQLEQVPLDGELVDRQYFQNKVSDDWLDNRANIFGLMPGARISRRYAKSPAYSPSVVARELPSEWRLLDLISGLRYAQLQYSQDADIFDGEKPLNYVLGLAVGTTKAEELTDGNVARYFIHHLPSIWGKRFSRAA